MNGNYLYCIFHTQNAAQSAESEQTKITCQPRFPRKVPEGELTNTVLLIQDSYDISI